MLRTLLILTAGSLATSLVHGAEPLAAESSVATLGLSQTAPDATTQPDAPMHRAVWKARTIDFTYLGMNTQYSCGTLRNKVTRIMEAVAAHRALKVAIAGCFNQFDAPGHYAVRVSTDMPALATPEELGRLASTRSERELIARVRGDTAAAAQAEEQFPAYWRRVTLSRKDMRIEPSDCELVEAVKTKVLPQLGVRVDLATLCRSRELSLNRPRLVAEVLSAVPH